jgi:O-antigen/teichoic acid export membrane protein
MRSRRPHHPGDDHPDCDDASGGRRQHRLLRRIKLTEPGHARRASYREGASLNALAFVVSLLFSVVSSVACSRLYGIDVIGQYALTIGAIAIVRLLSTTKERPALVRELTLLEPRSPRVTGLFVGTATFSTVLTLLVGVLVVLVARLFLSGPIAQPGLFWPLAVSVAGYVAFGNLCETLDTVASGFRAGRLLFWVRDGDALSFLLMAVALFGTNSVWGLVLALVISQAFGVLHRLVRMRHFMRFRVSRRVLSDGFATVPDLVRFGLKIAPGALADGFANQSGTWIVATFNPIAAVGAFGRAFLLVKQLMAVNLYASEMLFPTLVERHAKGDREGFARALADSLRYGTIAMLWIAVAGAGVATGVMHVFGAGFERGADALVVLLVIPALVVVAQTQRAALVAFGRPWLTSVAGFLRLGVALVAGILLTWQFGGIGAASALVIAFLIDIAFVTRYVVPHLITPLHKLWRPVEWHALAAACVGGFLAGRMLYRLLGYPFGLFAGAAASAVAFLVLLVITGGVNERDVARLRDLRRMAAARRRGSRAPETERPLEPEAMTQADRGEREPEGSAAESVL